MNEFQSKKKKKFKLDSHNSCGPRHECMQQSQNPYQPKQQYDSLQQAEDSTKMRNESSTLSAFTTIRHWRIGAFRLASFVLVVLALFSEESSCVTKPVDAFVSPFVGVPRNPRTASTTTSLKRPSSSSSSSSSALGLTIAEPLVTLAKTATDSYAVLLVEHPLPTKSLTAGLLCGISDVIAQKRSAQQSFAKVYNPQRTLRFASKGCFGGILWMYWYDWIDGFLTFSDAMDDPTATATSAPGISFYALLASLLPPESYQICIDHSGFTKTAVSMLLEQLFWCPLVYGTFEIPVSTLLNGGKPTRIPQEVNNKLNGLLLNNLYVWTPANLVIYNAPLEWRLFLGNVIDLFWQSIVSDVAADCGNDGEECALPEDGGIYNVEETMRAMAAAQSKSIDSRVVEKDSENDVVPGAPKLDATEESRLR